jgi:hypothetical protein
MGPYKMCQSCNGPGTRCRRCPLEDEDEDVETNESEGGTLADETGHVCRVSHMSDPPRCLDCGKEWHQ